MHYFLHSSRHNNIIIDAVDVLTVAYRAFAQLGELHQNAQKNFQRAIATNSDTAQLWSLQILAQNGVLTKNHNLKFNKAKNALIDKF